MDFELSLESNLFDLHRRLAALTWTPDSYQVFSIHDPKLRRIHKATVRDRVLYQAVYRALYQTFDRSFIHHSYSSRSLKGTHAGVMALEQYARKVTRNHTREAYALKCDIRKFFDSIDHDILFLLITRKVTDPNLLALIKKILQSFETREGKGLPLGNVTSQLFANIYMNELDQFMKHDLKAECYLRYCDDFVILSESEKYVQDCIPRIQAFCASTLSLELHPRKIIVRKMRQGIDFLGYVILPHRRVLRTNTKRRIFRKLEILRAGVVDGTVEENYFASAVQSYLGVLSHCKGRTTGVVGSGALSFNGMNQYVSASLSATGITSFSFSAWIQSSFGGGYVLGWGDLALLYAGNNFDSFSTSGGGYSGAYITTNLLDGKWHHLVGTYDGTNQNLYVDGVSVAKVSNSFSSAYATSFDIGQSISNGYFSGNVDDVRIYSRALSASEVQQLYAMGSSVTNTSGSGGGSSSPTTYTLSTTVSGSGTVTSSPSGISCGGTCSYYCDARKHYDYVTGLGSPLTDVF